MSADRLDPFADGNDIDPRPGDEVAEVMVVCTANIARSPLAMAMLDRQARARFGSDAPVWVHSSGVHGRAGQRAAEGSAAEAAARGLDLSAHRASPTDPDAVRRSDLVVTMTESHRAWINRLVPGATRKVFTLPELARLLDAASADGSTTSATEQEIRGRLRGAVDRAHRLRPLTPRPPGAEDVEDPYGGPRSGYATMADELEALVARVADGLFGPA